MARLPRKLLSSSARTNDTTSLDDAQCFPGLALAPPRRGAFSPPRGKEERRVEGSLCGSPRLAHGARPCVPKQHHSGRVRSTIGRQQERARRSYTLPIVCATEVTRHWWALREPASQKSRPHPITGEAIVISSRPESKRRPGCQREGRSRRWDHSTSRADPQQRRERCWQL